MRREIRTTGRCDRLIRQTDRRRERSQRQMLSRLLRGAFCTALIMLVCVTAGNFFSSAHDADVDLKALSSTGAKYYKSIRINQGDSVWSIAETYADRRYDTVKEYAEELIVLNNLDKDDPDRIFEGDYLTIAYYE